MNLHLTPEQFVDALEHPLPAERQAHLATCRACADELQEMRALMGDVTLAGEVPEPSPLFWDHLSSRVRAAVDAEPVPVAWWRAYWRPMVTAVGALAVVTLAVVLRPAAPAPAIETVAEVAEASLSAEAEAAFDMIGELAGSVEADAVMDAGLEPGSGAADAAIASLTPAERRELMNLLRAEMGSPAS